MTICTHTPQQRQVHCPCPLCQAEELEAENERLRVAIDKALDWCYRENLYGRGRNALELACTPAPQSAEHKA